MTIEAVVFDIGNVLIQWNPEAFYDRMIGRDRRKTLFDKVDLHGMNIKVDLGADMKSAVAALADQHPDWASEIRMWHENWIEMATPAIDHSVRLLRALRRRKMPVFALSNFGTKTFEQAEANYPFLEEFDARFISGHLGMIKPDPAIYAHLEAQTGVAPSALLFVDDRPENIAAAEACGWHGHLFEGAKGFEARLIAEGLIEDAGA